MLTFAELIQDSEQYFDAFNRIYRVLVDRLEREASRLGAPFNEDDEHDAIREAITTLLGPVPAE